jgi:hypothetical protein
MVKPRGDRPMSRSRRRARARRDDDAAQGSRIDTDSPRATLPFVRARRLVRLFGRGLLLAASASGELLGGARGERFT